MINIIIYLQFKLYLFFMRYISWIIFFLSQFNINIYAYKTKLAFNFNIIYIHKNSKKNEQIKRMELEGINYIMYKKLLIHYKDSIHHKKLSRVNMYIKHYIEFFKNSGFIKNIKLTSIKLNNKKIFTLNISTNTILKKIVITNYKELQISSSFIVKLFKNQIGLPKNYSKLDQSINKIYLWYKKKGFNWINIKIIQDKQPENIYLQINEGKISENILFFMSNKRIDANIKFRIENRIRKELYILPGLIFNTKKTEIGINYLKEIELISDCEYQTVQQQDGLKVFIKYKLFKDQITNIYYHDRDLNIDIPICLHQLFHTIKIYQLYNNIFTNLLPLKLIKRSIVAVKNDKIYSLYQNLIFRYASYSNNNYIKNFISNVKIINNIPYIDILISYPNIIRNQDSIFYLTIKLYYKLKLLNSLYPIESNKIICIQNNIYYSLFELRGIEILFKYSLSHNTYFAEKVNSINYSVQKNTIHVNSLFNECNITYFLNQNRNSIKTLYKKIKQNLVGFNMSLKYNTFYLNNPIKSGISLILNIISFISLPFNKLDSLYSIEYSYKYLYLQYHHSFIIPKIIKYIQANNNTFILFLELNLNLNNKDNLMLNELTRGQDNNIYNNLHIKKKYYKDFFPLYLCHIEYYTSINDYIAVYTFFNYIQNLSQKNYIKYFIYTNLYKYEINLGYGLQVNIPIKKIPSLRIEYGINNNNENFLQLRTYSQYS